MNKTLEFILDKARWAPSGDNEQPWKFKIISDTEIHVYFIVSPEESPYEYAGGYPIFVALGCLLENVRLAAAEKGMSVKHKLLKKYLKIELEKNDTVEKNTRLFDAIEFRSVDRYPYKTGIHLKPTQKQQLEDCFDGLEDTHVKWFEDCKSTWGLTRLLMKSSHVRMSIPETFGIHGRIIDWKNKLSPWGIPIAATGIQPISRGLVKKVLTSPFKLTAFLNKYLAGTAIPQFELDLLPWVTSSAQFTVFLGEKSKKDITDSAMAVEFGMRFQRFWLTAYSLGLSLQPAYGPLSFSYYAEIGHTFTVDDKIQKFAEENLYAKFKEVMPAVPSKTLFLCRLGYAKRPADAARSVRKDLSELMMDAS